MTYEELKKAYEESMQKCSELEKEIEDKDLKFYSILNADGAFHEMCDNCKITFGEAMQYELK